VCYFDTEQGPMALILVGAINVSAIETVWHGLVNSHGIQDTRYRDGDVSLKRGDEMGRFNLGSTVIVLTTDRLKWDPAITPGTTIKLGQALARTT
jgi:phosphatidylserine decarboxylase